MSAHGDDESVQRAMEHGAVSFLRKPFAEEVLLDSIELAIGRKSAAPHRFNARSGRAQG
jgi:FixJ family two-component response regulator